MVIYRFNCALLSRDMKHSKSTPKSFAGTQITQGPKVTPLIWNVYPLLFIALSFGISLSLFVTRFCCSSRGTKLQPWCSTQPPCGLFEPCSSMKCTVEVCGSTLFRRSADGIVHNCALASVCGSGPALCTLSHHRCEEAGDEPLLARPPSSLH